MLANLRPAGKYLMEDFYYAGGSRALLVQLGDLLDLSQRTVDGRTLGENTAGARVFNDDVIRARGQALVERDGLAVLRGNLAPDGAVIAAGDGGASAGAYRPGGGLQDYNDMAARIDDPALDVSADSVIVLQNAGPQGAPGMPEWGSCRSRRSCSSRACATWCVFGCAHERHQLWRLCAARGAGSLCGRSAGAGARRRHGGAGRRAAA